MSYFSADAKCPYYKHDNVKESTITCEGVLDGGNVKHHFVGGKAVLTRLIKEHCAADYESCWWYQIVTLKWKLVEDEKSK